MRSYIVTGLVAAAVGATIVFVLTREDIPTTPVEIEKAIAEEIGRAHV